MNNRILAPFLALGLSLSACKQNVNNSEDSIVDAGISRAVEQVLNPKSDINDSVDDFVFNGAVTTDPRDISGLESDYLSPGRIKFTAWRNMQLRRTFSSLNHNERPVIGSYEYKIMFDFVCNYAEQIKAHYDGLFGFDFDFITNDHQRKFTFSTVEKSISLELLEDTEFSHENGRRVIKPFKLKITSSDEKGNASSETIDFNKPLSDSIANEFMFLFKLILDSNAFDEELNVFRSVDVIDHSETPYYHRDARSLGFYNNNRFFADAVCEVLDPFEEPDGADSVENTPLAGIELFRCFVLAKDTSSYAKSFSSEFDKFNGNYPVMFVVKLPVFHNTPYKVFGPVKLQAVNVGFDKVKCSLDHRTLDNSSPYNSRPALFQPTPWSFDHISNGNMKTNRVNFLKFNGQKVSPTLVTFANFNNGRIPNVPILTYSNVKPHVCK